MISYYKIIYFRILQFVELIISHLLQSEQFFIEIDAAPGIRGSIRHLRVLQLASLPVAQPLRLADFLMEEVGIKLLQTHVLQSELLRLVLQFYEISRLELSPLMQLQQVSCHDNPTLGTVLSSRNRMMAGVMPVRCRRKR